jgi:hypothetical protein
MRKLDLSSVKCPARRVLAGLVALLMTAACASIDAVGGSRLSVKAWAEPKGFAEVDLHAGGFELFGLARHPAEPTQVLTIYIEGDGAAWPTPYHPPRDPTPSKPIALALAAADPAPAVAYLGRPCQYLDAAALAKCPSAYWLERRFAPDVIEATDAAVTKLKALSGAHRIRLIGHSGGGVVAALLAARRDDVEALVTVAAPLAVGKWIEWHGATPLTGSLDPIDLPKPWPNGVHFVGSDDTTVPVAILDDYVRAKGGHVLVMKGFDHVCCWSRDWAGLLQHAFALEAD